MESGRYRGAGRPLAQTAGIALIATMLAACGGGGGGGGSTGGASSAGSGAGTGTPTSGTGTLGPGGGLGSCPATRDTNANAFTLGVCSTVSANVEQNDIGFKDVPNSVTINDFGAKSYTLNLQPPVGSPVVLSVNADPALSKELRCQNVLGGRTGLTLQDPVSPGNQARSTMQSFTQGTSDAVSSDLCPNRRAVAAALSMRMIDFGTWERYVGGAELYYGGWYTRRAGATARPTVNVTFDGNSASIGGPGGISVGYLFSAVSSFGMSGVLSNVSYNASTSTIVGTLTNFQYSRAGDPVAVNAAVTNATFTATVAQDGTFTGALTGEGTLTPTVGQASIAATVAGRIEGVIIGDQSGFEVAGRYQASISGVGLPVVSARTVGSFAIPQ